MAVVLEDGKLRLSGYVGDYFFEDGFTSSDVVVALAAVEDSDPLAVHINSGGGIATEGAAIHALLTARAGRTDVVVEGIAASAASLIAMAGETVTMAAGSVMMIHDPSGYTFGTSQDHGKTIEGLEALATAYARVYATKSGHTADECRAIMKAERWFTPQQAVDQGFADATTEQITAEPVAAFDYRTYAHAPKRLTAMAKAKNWQLTAADGRAPAPDKSPRQTKETDMTDTTTAEAKAAELAAARAEAGKAAVASFKARRTAVMSMEAAKGREALADVLIETEMTEDAIKVALEAAPKAGVVDPADEPKPDAEAYAAERAKASGLAVPGSGKRPTNSLTINMRKLLGKEAA